MKPTIFTGSAVAIITPMHPDGSVNYEEFDRILNHQIENSTDAIVVCGTTGEASTMPDAEHLSVIERAVQTVNHRVPVIAGTGSNDTPHAVSLSCAARDLGVDALLLVTPYYNKTSQRGLIRHFNTIIDAAGLPAILYSVASRTGVNIAPETVKELAKNPLVCGIKEASGNIAQVAQIAADCGDEIALYSGNDDQIVPLLSLGGKGVISVLANVAPQKTHDICRLWFEGKVQESAQLQLAMLPLIHALFCDVNPMPVKAAMNLLGWNAGSCRMPLIDLDEAQTARVRTELQKAGLL